MEKAHVIQQIYISEWLTSHFEKDIYKFTKLKKYHNPDLPSFFYGLGALNDIKKIRNHKNISVIIWTGTDCKPGHLNMKHIDFLKNQNIYHIAISNFIEHSLSQFGFNYKIKPFYACNFDNYKPCNKGPCIYTYLGRGTDVYGIKTVRLLQKKFPDINFICTTNKKAFEQTKMSHPDIKYYPQDTLHKIYAQCFIGLRLTAHDGLSATVQDLGCMGIKTVWNGNSPSALNYKDINDIINHINTEKEKIGEIDYETAEKTKEFLTIKDDFYEISSYVN